MGCALTLIPSLILGFKFLNFHFFLDFMVKAWVFLDITRAEGHHISVVVPETTNIHLNTYL